MNENILPEYRKPFFNSPNSTIKLHPDFHHLSSSQAMCINFFYPLMHEKKLELITEFLGLPDEEVDYKKSVFEKESSIDSKGGHRPTNFDFYIETKSGKSIYFEIKYTESEFGKAKNDPTYVKKFNAVYKSELPGKVDKSYCRMLTFFEHYQIIRNLIHVGRDSNVVFLYPYQNQKIREYAEQARDNIVLPNYKNHVFAVTWYDLLEAIYPKTHSRKIMECYEVFDVKYL